MGLRAQPPLRLAAALLSAPLPLRRCALFALPTAQPERIFGLAARSPRAQTPGLHLWRARIRAEKLKSCAIAQAVCGMACVATLITVGAFMAADSSSLSRAGRTIQLNEDMDVCTDAKYRANSTGVVYLGQFSSHKECEAAVLAVPTSTAMWYADKDYKQVVDAEGGSKEKWGESCYARTDDKYAPLKRKHCSSGRVVPGGPPGPPPPSPAPPSPGPPPPGPPPQPTPPPPPGRACPFNCSLNGACTPAGKCSCDPAWVGDHCQTLALLPAKLESGLRQFDVAAGGGNASGIIPGNTSTWGGATLYDPKTGRWFMWATELTAHCGMHTWTTNSHTIRASSADPLGLYTREAEQFPIWSHEVDAVRDPVSGRYVAFYSRMKTGKAPPCTSCTDGTTAKSCKKLAVAPGAAGVQSEIEVAPPTYMASSLTDDPRGVWSEPVLVSMPTPQMDINAAPVILADGSVIGMWRDHHPSNKYSTPHLFTASNWSDPRTYVWESTPLFSTKEVAGPIEDMFMWHDKKRGGSYHVLFHLMYPKEHGTYGSHAYSLDGKHWTYTGPAYTSLTHYVDGGSVIYPYCERPHLIMDKDGEPIALTNGVKMGAQAGMDNDDQSFTLLRPLRTN